MIGHRKLAAATLASMLVLGGTACGGGSEAGEKLAEKIIEDQGGGDVDIDADDGSVKYTDEDGNTSEIGDGATLPEGWPEDLAPPDSVTIISSSTNTVAGAKTLYVIAEGEGTVEDFFGGIKTQVQDAGYEVTSDNSMSGTDGGYAALSADGDQYTLTASITDGTDEGTVNITMSLTEVSS